MSRYKKNINTIYISERMQECLRCIKESPLTTIIAPMGYGKTTAVSWYLNKCITNGDLVFRLNIYSDDVNMFWQSFCSAFSGTSLAEKLNKMKFPVGELALGVFVELIINFLKTTDKNCFLFLDDYHLLGDVQVEKLLLKLADIPTRQLHTIIASRSMFLSHGEEIHLGQRLHRITVNDLRLNPTELAVYSHRCGVTLEEKAIASLSKLTEGWFSAVYLNLKSFAEQGRLLDDDENIYEMIGHTFVDTLDEKAQSFLCIMSLADEFSIKQAAYMTQENAKQLIEKFINNNAFVHWLPDRKTYRLHHMLKECLHRRFQEWPPKEQMFREKLFAQWLHSQKDYYYAAIHFEKANDWDGLWNSIGEDWGHNLGASRLPDVLRWHQKTPEENLLRHPKALVVLMANYFHVKKIPEMLETQKQLVKSLAQCIDLSEREREEIEGEMLLRMSFLKFNNISGMSEYHRRIHRLRPELRTTWAQGSPSVLALYHSVSGALDRENEEMQECMPIYSQLAYGHGTGAIELMRGETALLRGNFTDAEILCKQAETKIKKSKDYGMYLAMEFLSSKIMFYQGAREPFARFLSQREELLKTGNYSLVATLELIEGWLHLLYEEIPENFQWISEPESEESYRVYPMLRPIVHMFARQALLVQKNFIQVIAQTEQFEKDSSRFILCLIYLHIQTAVANVYIGRRKEAREELKTAFELALPDGILLPFAETDRELDEIFNNLFPQYPEAISRIFDLKKHYLMAKDNYVHRVNRKEKVLLSDREFEIAELMAERLTNKEISAKLFLSEGTVRQYITQIYSKLELKGSPKDKRSQIIGLIKKVDYQSKCNTECNSKR